MKEMMVFYFAVISFLLAVMVKLEVQCWIAKRDLQKGLRDENYSLD